MLKKIVIKGAKEHNLKNITLEIPKEKFVVITGLSGSGKSSLAFDTVYAEGQRRYVESLSAYARQFLDKMKKPNVDLIEGLSPAISIEQKNTSKNPRSTVATVTEIYDYMRVLYARAGIPYSPFTGKPIVSQSVSDMVDKVKALPKSSTIFLLSPTINKISPSSILLAIRMSKRWIFAVGLNKTAISYSICKMKSYLDKLSRLIGFEISVVQDKLISFEGKILDIDQAQIAISNHLRSVF